MAATDDERAAALASALERQADELRVQADALRMAPANRTHAIVRRYVLDRGGKSVARWANDDQGWRLPGAEGGERRYTGNDVLDLVRQPGEAVPAGLLELAAAVLAKNTTTVERRWG